MWNSPVGRVLRLAFTLGLILLVCYKAGFFTAEGRANFLQGLTGVNWWLVAASIAVNFLQVFVNVWKWRIVVAAKRMVGGVWQLLEYVYVGRLYNLILPSSMGGDVVRIYRLGKLNDNVERAAASVFVERFTGMLILLVFSAAALVVSLRFSGELYLLSLGFVLLLTTLLGWMAIDPRIADKLSGWVAKLNKGWLTKGVEKFGAFQESIRDLGKDRGFLVRILLLSVLFYVFAVANVWVSALAFDRSVAFIDMVIAVPIIMLIMNLPVSIGGLGLMEASYTIGFEMLGYGAELGLLTALLMRAKTLIDALVGGLFELKDSVISRPQRQ